MSEVTHDVENNGNGRCGDDGCRSPLRVFGFAAHHLGSTVGAAPAPVSYAAAAPADAATSPTVEVPGERVVGTDPDANVRLDLARNAGFHLHGGN